MVISPSFDFMESFCQLCLVKSEKMAKKARYLALFWLKKTKQRQNKAFYKPLKGQKSCPWQNQVPFRVLRGN